MAEEDKSEKTEQPTERKLRQAREKGDVPKSQEIPGWFILAAGLGIIAVMGPGLARGMAETLQIFFANAHQLSLQPGEAIDLAMATGLRIGLVVAFAFLALVAAAILGNTVQQGLLFTHSKLEPKLSKLNPVEGLKRMFGPQGWVNFFKGVGKMGLVTLAIAIVLWPKRDELAALPAMDLIGMLQLLRADAILLMFAALAVYSLIAAADFIFQRHEFMERNKMSRKEIKDELKDTEGDPMVRAKLRQIRQERAQRRMMSKVPEAAVVITNPTHYAGPHARARLHRQGGGRRRLPHSRDCRGERYPHRGGSPARARPARQRRTGRLDPGRPLPGRGQGDRLCPLRGERGREGAKRALTLTLQSGAFESPARRQARPVTNERRKEPIP